jgi:hypothetical protein
MYPKRMVLRILGLTLLVTLIGLAPSACGGGGGRSGEEEAKVRHIPEGEKALPPANTIRRSSGPRPPSGSTRAGVARERRPTRSPSPEIWDK